MNPPPLVTLITVNYNAAEVTCALLDSIRRQDYHPVQVIVVDNGSRENPEQLFALRYPEVQCIRSEHNLGFAGGNKLALPHARGEYLFFVNNDAELTEGCIARLLAFFEKTPAAGIASPLICYFPAEPSPVSRPYTVIQYAGMTRINPLTGRNRTVGNGEPDRGQFATPVPTAYAHGAAMMIPRGILESAGFMEERFFLYYEELDWCERIRRAGFSVWVEPRARVFHKESMTVAKMGALKTYYLNRNRVWFMRRNSGGWRLAVFFMFLFAVTIPKNALLFLWRGETDNLRAFLSGIGWNFGLKFSKYEV
jgi:GT2 family glycosyltransferase